MIPRCKITIIPISGPTEIDETLAEAVEAWNDEWEDVDEVGDENDDPRTDEQP